MSRAQGDGYRTYTDHSLNAYRARLDVKVHKLVDEKITYKVITNNYGEELLLYMVQGNKVDNPNGSWKWEGWKVTGRYYRLSLYKAGTYSFDTPHAKANNTVDPTDLPLFHFTGEDTAIANQMYKEYLEMARDYRISELDEISQNYSTEIYFK